MEYESKARIIGTLLAGSAAAVLGVVLTHWVEPPMLEVAGRPWENVIQPGAAVAEERIASEAADPDSVSFFYSNPDDPSDRWSVTILRPYAWRGPVSVRREAVNGRESGPSGVARASRATHAAATGGSRADVPGAKDGTGP